MSPATLADDWTEAMTTALQARELSADAALTVTVQITGTGNGDVVGYWRVENGWLRKADEADDDALLVTAPVKDALPVLDSTVPLAVGFMRGKIKISGDPGQALALLRASTKPQ